MFKAILLKEADGKVQASLQDLDEAELGGHCPHGRP